MNDAIINFIAKDKNLIFINVELSEKIEAWLEDKNKHYPYIFSLKVDNKNCIIIEYQSLYRFLKNLPEHMFKLSCCTIMHKVNYHVISQSLFICWRDIDLYVTKTEIFFQRKTYALKKKNHRRLDIKIDHHNKEMLEGITDLPVETFNIGTCFSRSIFRSSAYFNPNYKQYFHVGHTVFHSSFISIFSKKIQYDYLKINDLKTGDASKYVKIEFKKNIEDLLQEKKYQLVVVDNYIDATAPIIKYGKDMYLTYNKYFSESIFKRFFSSCEIIYPGTTKHLKLYRKKILLFKKLLIQNDIQNVVLIGGRLSKYKIDELKMKIDVWSDKMEWIEETNNNWDMLDKIFLDKLPETFYIDRRKTNWKSDVYSPILGGASPSHYQREYYKEIFKELLNLLNRKFEDGSKNDY